MSEVEEVSERTASAETVFTTISTCRLKKTIKGLEVECTTFDMGLQLFDDLFLGGEGVLGLRTLSALRRDHALMRNTYHLKLGTERVLSCGGRSSIFEAFLDASLYFDVDSVREHCVDVLLDSMDLRVILSHFVDEVADDVLELHHNSTLDGQQEGVIDGSVELEIRLVHTCDMLV